MAGLWSFELRWWAEVALVLEGPLGVGAVGVYIAVVFLELCVAAECLRVAAADSVIVRRPHRGSGIYIDAAASATLKQVQPGVIAPTVRGTIRLSVLADAWPEW